MCGDPDQAVGAQQSAGGRNRQTVRPQMHAIRAERQHEIHPVVDHHPPALRAHRRIQFLREGQQLPRGKVTLPHLHGAKTSGSRLSDQRNERAAAGLPAIRDEIEGKINAGHEEGKA
jgi:hypothetical protein